VLLVFPRLSITWATNHWPAVIRAVEGQDGGLRVWVEHGQCFPGERFSNASAVYDLDAQLRPVAATLSPEFRALVARMVAARLMPVGYEAADRTDLWSLKIWRGAGFEPVERSPSQ
jgi:hypothetical protein